MSQFRVADKNLTQLEVLALASRLNVADGHARQSLTPSQAKIISDLPVLFDECEQTPVEELESNAHQAVFDMLGQHSYPRAPGQVLSCYASSVAMEIFARALGERTRCVALIHPTFDNIPDLLRGNGLSLIPLSEDIVKDEDLPAELMQQVGAVFITTPNNPTGRIVGAERLRRLAEQCAHYGVVLALDTSFRGFDPRAQYDHYAILERSGCRWVVIEDTGKLWPTLDLKIGMLVFSEHVDLPLYRIHSDILLGVSPLILGLVTRFAIDGAQGGLADLQRFIAGNRSALRSGLAGLSTVSFPDPDSRVSVERVQLVDVEAVGLWHELRERNVYALPCRAFHWADPAQGAQMMRIALARSPDRLVAATRALRSVLTVAGRPGLAFAEKLP